MAKRKANKKLGVYLNNLPLGVLGYSSRKALTFTYRQEWLERPNAFPISRRTASVVMSDCCSNSDASSRALE